MLQEQARHKNFSQPPSATGTHDVIPSQIHSENRSASNYLSRKSPLLLRIHADDQDKKTLCLFWVIFVVLVILIAIIGRFALPNLYVTIPSGQGRLNCNNPSGLSGNQVTCADFSLNNLVLGYVIIDWQSVNQYGVINLQIVPINLDKQIYIHQNFSISTYTVFRVSNPGDPNRHLKVNDQKILTSVIDFSSEEADKLYSADGSKVIGYIYPLAIIYNMPQNFLIRVNFTKSSDFTVLSSVNLQVQSVNPKFTVYTIAVRYTFFILSAVGLVLYLVRFLRIPSQKKIMEQRMVAVISVLLLMFNDPFYIFTVLAPNGFSAFFSTLFIVNLVVILFLFWLMTADRIYFNEDNTDFKQFFTLRKIIYIAVCWVQLTVCLMIYSMAQINQNPLLSQSFLRKYIAARVMIPITFSLGVGYVGFRYINIYKNNQGKLWRDYIFMIFSSIFIIVLLTFLAANSLVIYNYSGPQIMIVFGLTNTYIYYLQYMFTITKDEIYKIENNNEIQESQNYDVRAVVADNFIEVNLHYSQKQTNKQEEVSAVKMIKQRHETTEQQTLKY